MNDGIVIRPMDKHDDILKTAQLIYETAEEFSWALFGKKEIALRKIKALIQLDNNSFSRKNILIACDKDRIYGILVGYNKNSINIKEQNKDFNKAMSLFARLRCGLVMSFVDRIMNLNNIEGYYIQSLCVDSASRGKRIGYRLLEYCFKVNKEQGVNNVYLDLESTNKIALNLYKKVGFELFKESEMKTAGISIYRMRKKLMQVT